MKKFYKNELIAGTTFSEEKLLSFQENISSLIKALDKTELVIK